MKVKKLLNSFITNFKIGLNGFLEMYNMGLAWEYYNKTHEFMLHGHKRTVTMLYRKNLISGNHYYRTMRPVGHMGVRTFDDNEWVYTKSPDESPFKDQ